MVLTLVSLVGARWNISILDFIFAPKKGGGSPQGYIPLGTISNLKNKYAFKRQNNLESAHGPTSPPFFLLEFVQHVSCEGCTIISFLFKDTHNSHGCCHQCQFSTGKITKARMCKVKPQATHFARIRAPVRQTLNTNCIASYSTQGLLVNSKLE